MQIGMAVNEGSFGSGVASIIDIVRVADAVRGEVDPTIPPIDLHLAGPSARIALSTEMTLQPNCGLDDLGACDVIVVPALGTLTAEATRERLAGSGARAIRAALEGVDPTVSRLAAACTGVFALAEGGHLDGRRATTSWFLGADFRSRYPEVTVELDEMVVTDGPITTAGAAFAHIDLALSLLRTVSSDLARHVAQLLVIDERPSQATFIAYDHVQHDDQLVIDFERYVRSSLDQPFDAKVAASSIGTSRRTLERRVRDVLGLTPLGFVQRLRVERARHLQATTDLTTEDIALRVGYANAESLRALIRRTGGPG
ncbi:MAG: helix-turn-helix domain-containing protein [Actinomycetota bacterium]